MISLLWALLSFIIYMFIFVRGLLRICIINNFFKKGITRTPALLSSVGNKLKTPDSSEKVKLSSTPGNAKFTSWRGRTISEMV